MKLYLAGIAGDKMRKHLMTAKSKRWLASFYPLESLGGIMADMRLYDATVMLDSGAFSAWSQGLKIDREQYLKFLDKYGETFVVRANLDVIGSAEASLDNWEYLRKHKQDTFPVFHTRESYDMLEYYCQETGLIALGGMAGGTGNREYQTTHLDHCFSIIQKYWPVRVHGFGITAPWALFRYPFYSVDSTTWLSSCRFGSTLKWNKTRMTTTDTRMVGVARRINAGQNVPLKTIRALDGDARIINNIKMYLKIEKDVTETWAKRGISWDE